MRGPVSRMLLCCVRPMAANASDTKDSADLHSSSSNRQRQDVIMLEDGRNFRRDQHSTGISMFLSASPGCPRPTPSITSVSGVTAQWNIDRTGKKRQSDVD